MEGEGLVSCITWMTSVSTLVDRGGEGSLIERTHFPDAFFVFNQERYTFHFANIRNSSAWGRNYKISPLVRSFDRGPLPPSVYLGWHWCHSHDTWYQTFPLHFCILQVIKNWMVGRPGNEARQWMLRWTNSLCLLPYTVMQVWLYILWWCDVFAYFVACQGTVLSMLPISISTVPQNMLSLP